ncbi:hypothetical protein F8388_011012 [Cannabis sativa]|uniref:Uncharacterized protein n=1 Tax=Cannabis sativa TaxID=3483 RepID=A0A7J6EFA6_CANSA|nr:hypothetical protein G4B88_025131 [Cannabis sativa]KAF4372985.1 hypothetical protein F8388_011012 [Cannabis sativa]
MDMAATKNTNCTDERWSLEGKTALVTGGSRGIGHAIVEELAKFGAIVHTCCRKENELDKCLEEWKKKGFKISGSVCDVSQRDQREKLIETVSSIFQGKLDILVNNAGVAIVRAPTEYSAEDYEIQMRTNFESAFHFSQLSYPLLKASGNGSIVFISSIGATVAFPAGTLYAATKGAINQMTKNLACEWAKDNIRANTEDGNLEGALGEFIDRTPIRRLAEPNEISSMVVFLCLPAASFVTGQVISIDGGFTVNAFPSPT